MKKINWNAKKIAIRTNYLFNLCGYLITIINFIYILPFQILRDIRQGLLQMSRDGRAGKQILWIKIHWHFPKTARRAKNSISLLLKKKTWTLYHYSHCTDHPQTHSMRWTDIIYKSWCGFAPYGESHLSDNQANNKRTKQLNACHLSISA